MSAFDRLQNYSAKRGLNETSEVFDTSTPSGAFLNRVHSEGYNMYEYKYRLKPEFQVSDDDLALLSEEEQEEYASRLIIDEKTYSGVDNPEQYEKVTCFTELHDAITTSGNQIINASAGSGKALQVDTPVLTAEGYVEIGSLRVGDKVYGTDGKLHEVTGVFPQGKKKRFGFMCSDGVVIPCCEEHLWTLCNKDYSSSVTKTTKELMEMADSGASSDHIWLPKVSPIEFSDRKVDFDDSALEDFMRLGILSEDLLFASVESRISAFNKMLTYWYEEGDLNFETALSSEKSLGVVIGTEDLFGNYLVSDDLEDTFSFFLNSLGFGCNFEEDCVIIIPPSQRGFVGIREYGCDVDMICISVDADDHLFLTGAMIPTHNTTAITFKILYDIVTGEAMTIKQIESGLPIRVVNRMWVSTFLKTGAEELEASVSKWQRKLGYSETANQIAFSTMDAEFKRCLNAMGVATPIGDAQKLHSLFCKAVDSCAVTRSGGYNLTKEDYQILSGILVYYRGRLDEKRYQHPSMGDYDLTPTILDLIAKQFANLRQTNGIMDFEEIMELLYKYLYVTPNPAVQEFIANRYNYIYIDEFQDTSQMAYAILKFYARGKLWLNRSGVVPAEDVGGLYTGSETLGKLVVIGDPSQCLTSDMSVLMADGTGKQVVDICVGDEIQTIWGSDVVTNVNAFYRNGYVLTIQLSDGKSISITPEHKFFVRNHKSPVHDSVDYGNAELYLVFNGGSFYVLTEGNATIKALNCKYEDFDSAVRDGIFTAPPTFFKFSDYDSALAYCKNYCNRYFANYYEVLLDPSDSADFSESYTAYVSAECEKDFDIIGEVLYEACQFVDNSVLCAFDILEGDELAIYDDGRLNWCRVDDIIKQSYCGFVYDISTKNTKSFITSGVVNHNCIYSFRGSDSSILVEDVERDFRPCLSHLSVNWRCPANILNPIIPSIHINPDSANQGIIPARQGGEFYAYAFPSIKQMIAQLKVDITKDSEDDMKSAILCRTNFDGLIPAVILAEDGRFKFSISGENMTLNSPLPRKIIGVTSLFTERSTPAVKTTLQFFSGRGNDWQVKQLVDVLKVNNMSVWQLPIEDIKYSCPSLVNFISSVRKIFYIDGVRDKSKEIEALRAIYTIMMVDTFSGDSAYCESARAYIQTLLYILENNDFQSVYEFLEEIELLNDKLAGSIKKKSAPIQIATVHESKGKEYDSVYVWNDSEGVYPSSKCDIYNPEQVAEERRVHYIACTRAKKREHIYTLQNKKGLFAKEMNIDWYNPVNPSVKLPKTSSDLIL